MPYRDDQPALEARRDDLRHELEAVRRRAAEARELAAREGALERELASVEERLARAGRRLPLLDRIEIASPCSASWEAMRGDDRVRFCESCQKNVYDLSAMARAEAEQLVADREGSLCVRFYRRQDGTVMTADCPVGVKKKRRKRVAMAVVGAGAMTATAMAAMATATQGTPRGIAFSPEQPVGTHCDFAEPPPTSAPEKQVTMPMGAIPPVDAFPRSEPSASAKAGGVKPPPHRKMGKMVMGGF